MRLPDSSKSRAVLVGTASYRPDSGFATYPEIARSLDGFAEFLRTRTGLREVVTVSNPADAVQIAVAVEDAAQAATDLLLFYYVGHGVAVDNQLHLTHSESLAGKVGFSTTSYPQLRRLIKESPAKVKIVILDCCHSGKAFGRDILASGTEVLEEATDIDGAFVLTATDEKTKFAGAAGVDGRTAFTGAMLGVLASGIPSAGPYVTISALYRELLKRLPAANLPKPKALERGTAASLALARNVAWVPAISGLPNAPTTSHSTQICESSAYAPRLLTDIGWLRRMPDPGETLVRRNGALTVTMRPGVSIDKDRNAIPMRLPHGLMARQLLIWLCSEAIRTGDAELYPTDRETGFFATTGVDVTSGPDGTVIQLLEQIEQLYSTDLVVEDNNDRFARSRRITVISEYEFGESSALTSIALPYTKVQLSGNFIEDAVFDMTPIDWRVVTQPGENLLVVDVYLWLAACASAIRRDIRVSWHALWQQFEKASLSPSRSEARKFEHDFRCAADHVKAAYPSLRVKFSLSELGAVLSPDTHSGTYGVLAGKRSSIPAPVWTI
ncbi:replication protein RepA [Nocardia rhamnosiphila]|uniref:caspase, EACC1-associated type n=1 Tax=Nocardia rhamnosiphila TaxID=426716 RepID=UPI0033C68438